VSSPSWLNVVQWCLLGFFLIPLVEVGMMAVGTLYAHTRYRMAPWKFRTAIIQITTVGKEADLVRSTVESIRAYHLPFPHEVWVVNEPGQDNDYPRADWVITVPADFVCRPVDKARALEYSRRIREQKGLDGADVKIILVDDDTLPTRSYFLKAFGGDYDLCQGATIASRDFAFGGIRHFAISHLDNMRVRNCMIYCSCTQGISGKPLYVHGEGLTITGLVESKITWDHPIIASDDLVFGTRAAYEGFSWGYFNAAVQIVSPWTFRDMWRQRKRWTWGNFTAMGNREILPLSVAVPKALKYLVGCVSTVASGVGAVLLWKGITRVPPQAHIIFLVSLGCWIASYGLAGWISSGGESNRQRLLGIRHGDSEFRHRPNALAHIKYWAWRVFQTIAAVALCPLAAVVPFVVIVGSLLTGKPKRFVVIDKTNPNSRGKKPAVIRTAGP
jgi:Glycosyl transferase family group 2